MAVSEATMTNESIEDRLSAVPIFSGTKGRALKKLARLCVPRTFAAGETMIQEGATGLGLFLITTGTVEVFMTGDRGKLILATRGPGDFLGEIALVDDQPRSASAVAQTATECLLLTRASFETLVKKEPEVAWRIVPGLAQRIRELDERALKAQELRDGADSEGVPPRAASTAQGPADGESESSAADDGAESAAAAFARFWLVGVPYGLMLGGVTGMSAMARSWESFLSKLAEETRIAEAESLSDILCRAPEGLASAGREAISELLRLPGEIADSYQKVQRDD